MSKKSLALFLALALLIGGAVGGTIAWLTAESQEVKNTFSVGNITIDLNEHKLGTDGELKLDEEPIKTNDTDYKVIPGTTQKKDPFVTVKAGSEECYVYVTVTNNLVIDNKTVATLNIDKTKWIQIGSAGNTILYRYVDLVDASAAIADVVIADKVFTTVTYSGEDITKDNIEQLNDKTIVVKAYAHQFAEQTIEQADKAANAWAGTTANATPPTT